MAMMKNVKAQFNIAHLLPHQPMQFFRHCVRAGSNCDRPGPAQEKNTGDFRIFRVRF
jgi:hypothetical protein